MLCQGDTRHCIFLWVRTFVKFFWPPGGGRLYIDCGHTSKWRNDRLSKLWFGVPFAIEMGWLRRKTADVGDGILQDYELGPYLKQVRPKSLVGNLWKVQGKELELYVDSDWNIDLHSVRHFMDARLLHVYSNAVESSALNDKWVELLAEVDYKRDGKGYVYVEPRRIRYLPVRNLSLEILETRVTESDGKDPIDVIHGHTALTLHFIRRSNPQDDGSSRPVE